MAFDPEFFKTDSNSEQTINPLLQYLQKQQPEVLNMVAQSASSQIKHIITHNVRGIMGVLPSDHFNVHITTDRENLATLLASAMMTGYFLRQMEQRMDMEIAFRETDSL